MKSRYVAVLLTAALIAGCAGASRRPAGPPLIAVGSGDASALAKDFRADLRDISADAIGVGKLDPTLSDRELSVELPAEALFEEGNAQLKTAALKPLADIAAVAASRGACVVHVIAFAPDEQGADLAERRAASVAASLSRHAVAPARLRNESRIAGGGNPTIVVDLRLVVIGRENEAWMPPSLER